MVANSRLHPIFELYLATYYRFQSFYLQRQLGWCLPCLFCFIFPKRNCEPFLSLVADSNTTFQHQFHLYMYIFLAFLVPFRKSLLNFLFLYLLGLRLDENDGEPVGWFGVNSLLYIPITCFSLCQFFFFFFFFFFCMTVSTLIKFLYMRDESNCVGRTTGWEIVFNDP